MAFSPKTARTSNTRKKDDVFSRQRKKEGSAPSVRGREQVCIGHFYFNRTAYTCMKMQNYANTAFLCINVFL